MREMKTRIYIWDDCRALLKLSDIVVEPRAPTLAPKSSSVRLNTEIDARLFDFEQA